VSTRDEEIARRLQEITNKLREVTTALQNLIKELSRGTVPSTIEMTELEGQIRNELGDNIQYVDLYQSRNEIRIRPKRFLGSEIFRSIAGVARNHGGRWDRIQRSFIIFLQKPKLS